MFGPPLDFLGGRLKFLRAIYYHQWNTTITFFFTKAEKIGRSDRLLLSKTEKTVSLIERKKISHWSDCYLLSILRNSVGKFEINIILLSLYFIYLSTSLHLSEVSDQYPLWSIPPLISLPTWAFPSENVCYVIWLKKRKSCQDNFHLHLTGRLRCQ